MVMITRHSYTSTTVTLRSAATWTATAVVTIWLGARWDVWLPSLIWVAVAAASRSYRRERRETNHFVQDALPCLDGRDDESGVVAVILAAAGGDAGALKEAARRTESHPDPWMRLVAGERLDRAARAGSSLQRVHKLPLVAVATGAAIVLAAALVAASITASEWALVPIAAATWTLATAGTRHQIRKRRADRALHAALPTTSLRDSC